MTRQTIVNMPYSLIFNGSTQYGTASSATPYQIATKTIEYWAKPRLIASGVQIIFSLGNNYCVGFASSNKTLLSYNQFNGSQISPGGIKYTPNVWQHFVFTCSVIGSGSLATILWDTYINGVLVQSSVNNSGMSGTYGSSMYIGSFAGTTDPFAGELGQITYYSTTLTQAQVLQRYQNVSAQSVAPGSVVSQWLLTEGTGSALYDSVGSTYITLTGSPTWTGDSPFKTRTKATVTRTKATITRTLA